MNDYLAVLDGKPFSCDTKEDELWAILLEKAWAKMHGSYQRIEGGLPSNALFALTGKPSWRHIHEVTPDLFKILNSYEKRNFIMVSGTSGSNEQE